MAKINDKAERHITDYIQALPDFSKEICLRLRELILSADPDMVEDWKWGPNYNCHGMVCGFGAFKKHVKLSFFRGAELDDKNGLFNHCVDNISLRSIKYTHVDEIEPKQLTALLKEAATLNKTGAAPKKETQKEAVPEALANRLQQNEVAHKQFMAMSHYKQKEFIEQVNTAKRPETLAKRLEKIEELLEKGMGWNDKHRNKAS